MKCMYCGCTDLQACPGGCWWTEPNVCSTCSAKLTHIEPGQLWRDVSGHARICGVVPVEEVPYAVLLRAGDTGRKRVPFLRPVASLLASDHRWQHIPERVTGKRRRGERAAAQQLPARAAYSIDADPDGIRARVADAIAGALAFGAQETHMPPDGHWLAPFWTMARTEAMNARPVPEAPEGTVKDSLTVGPEAGRVEALAREIFEAHREQYIGTSLWPMHTWAEAEQSTRDHWTKVARRLCSAPRSDERSAFQMIEEQDARDAGKVGA